MLTTYNSQMYGVKNVHYTMVRFFSSYTLFLTPNCAVEDLTKNKGQMEKQGL